MHQQLGHRALPAANLGQLSQFVFVDWMSLLCNGFGPSGTWEEKMGRRSLLTTSSSPPPQDTPKPWAQGELLEPYDLSIVLGVLSAASSGSCPRLHLIPQQNDMNCSESAPGPVLLCGYLLTSAISPRCLLWGLVLLL